MDPVVLLWESQGNSSDSGKSHAVFGLYWHFIEWENAPKEIGDLTDFVHITR